jgi:hypothetical protein
LDATIDLGVTDDSGNKVCLGAVSAWIIYPLQAIAYQ